MAADAHIRAAEDAFDAREPLQWLHLCAEAKQAHFECRKNPFGIDTTPTRLLDVGTYGQWPCSPCLISTENRDPGEVRYVALTHTWTNLSDYDKQVVSTDTSNLARRYAGIPLMDFPDRYKAVIVLCRCLRIRYLWVDSLCIVQGPGGDWETESIRMARIYSSALLTISINTSQDLFQTLLRPEYSPSAPADWIEAIHRLPDDGYPILELLNFWLRALDGGLIGQRGWCLQERQLSPRILHLLDSGTMLMECRAQVHSNLKPSHFLPFTGQRMARRLSAGTGKIGQAQRFLDLLMTDTPVVAGRNATTQKDQTSFEHHLRPRLEVWHELLINYSQRDLSYPSDNLVALSGLVECMQTFAGTTYLSGIWEEDLPGGLLWARHRNSDPGPVTQQWRRFPHYQAPSWSWASVNGETQRVRVPASPQNRLAPDEMIDLAHNSISMVRYIGKKAIRDHELEPLREGSYIAFDGLIGQMWCITDSTTEPNLFGTTVEGAGPFHDPQPFQATLTFDVPDDCTAALEPQEVWCLCLLRSKFERDCFGIGLQSVNNCKDRVQQLSSAALEESDTSVIPAPDVERSFRRVGMIHLELPFQFEEWEHCFGQPQRVWLF